MWLLGMIGGISGDIALNSVGVSTDTRRVGKAGTNDSLQLLIMLEIPRAIAWTTRGFLSPSRTALMSESFCVV